MRSERKRQGVASGEAAVFVVSAIAIVSFLIAGCTEWKSSSGLRGGRSGSAPVVVSDTEIARAIARIRPVRGNAKSHLLLAKHYQKRERHREAIPEFWKVLAIDPEHIEALIGMGVSFDAMEYYARAQEAFRIALKIDPSSHVAQNNLGYSNFLAGNFEEAVSAMEKAVALNDQVRRYHNNLARAYFETGEYENARSQFKRGAGEAGADYLMGHFFYKKGMYPEAEKSFSAALAAAPEMEAARKGQEAARALAVITATPEERTVEADVVALEPVAGKVSGRGEIENRAASKEEPVLETPARTKAVEAAGESKVVELARVLAATPLPEESEEPVAASATASLQPTSLAKVVAVEGMSVSGISSTIVTIEREINEDRPLAEKGSIAAAGEGRGVVVNEVQVAASVSPSMIGGVPANAHAGSESAVVSGRTLPAAGHDGGAGQLAAGGREITARADGVSGGEARADGLVATVADHRAATKSEVGARAHVSRVVVGEEVAAEAVGTVSGLPKEGEAELTLAKERGAEVPVARTGELPTEKLSSATGEEGEMAEPLETITAVEEIAETNEATSTESPVLVTEEPKEVTASLDTKAFSAEGKATPIAAKAEIAPPPPVAGVDRQEELKAASTAKDAGKLILVRCHVRQRGDQDVTVLQFMRLVDYLGSIEIEVANASGMDDLGEDMSGYLKGRGYGNISSRTEDPASSRKTKIFYSEEYLQPAFLVAKDIPGYQEMEKITGSSLSQAKIMILIGEDMTRHAALFRAREHFAFSTP